MVEYSPLSSPKGMNGTSLLRLSCDRSFTAKNDRPASECSSEHDHEEHLESAGSSDGSSGDEGSPCVATPPASENGLVKQQAKSRGKAEDSGHEQPDQPAGSISRGTTSEDFSSLAILPVSGLPEAAGCSVVHSGRESDHIAGPSDQDQEACYLQLSEDLSSLKLIASPRPSPRK